MLQIVGQILPEGYKTDTFCRCFEYVTFNTWKAFCMCSRFHVLWNLSTCRTCFMFMCSNVTDSEHMQNTCIFIPFLTAHNWQNWKRVFLPCYWYEIYRVEACGLKNSNYAWQNYDCCEYVKFGAISWKMDILPIIS